jgi:hypothetical protein
VVKADDVSCAIARRANRREQRPPADLIAAAAVSFRNVAGLNNPLDDGFLTPTVTDQDSTAFLRVGGQGLSRHLTDQ